MKKHFGVLILALTLAAFTPCEAYAQKKKPVATQKKPLTPEERLSNFYKKWNQKFELFSNGQMNYGWPKQFFIDMAAAMPERFQWEKVGTERGLVAYKFVFKRNEDPYSEAVLVGALVFQGTKLYAMEVDAWG